MKPLKFARLNAGNVDEVSSHRNENSLNYCYSKLLANCNNLYFLILQATIVAKTAKTVKIIIPGV